jgi:predicted NUDIX family NTP pyrophosphohydrolase
MSSSYVLVFDFNQSLMFKVSTSEKRTCWWEILWYDYYAREDGKLQRRPELQRVSWYCLSYHNEDIGKIWRRSND